MFTGIIEEVGKVAFLERNANNSQVKVMAKKVLKETKLGDSIAVNGVCLTATHIGSDYFIADIMDETYRRSNLGNLRKGSIVNLERALTLQSRLGGHIVTGHIDGTGKIEKTYKEDIATWIVINTSIELLKYIVEKGSISIDGISLTVAYVSSECFKVSIIPHTGEETTLLTKKVGDIVNIECDIVGKYIEKFINNKNEKNTKQDSISEKFLLENGFF